MKKLFIAGYANATQNYRDAFARLHVSCDTLPVREHGFLQESTLPLYLFPANYHGLVLPGGGDIEPSLFHAENKGSYEIDEPLDRLQLQILKEFLHARKPILGICKGLQIINVYFGGTIIQNLPEESLHIHKYEGRDKLHSTKAARGTFPERLYGGSFVTNSAHHQGVGSVGDGLLVAEYSSDFVVEAMYHEKFSIIGVQWHPERMCFAYANSRTADGSLLLRYFLSLC